MQQGQEVTADGVVIGFHFNAFAIVRKMVPVEQHGAVACHQFVGNVACAGVIVVVLLWCDAAQNRYAGAHHVHWVRGRWQLFQSDFDRLRQAAHALQFRFVVGQLGFGWQCAVYQQMRDFFKFAFECQIHDVVTTVVQVVARAANGTQCGIACGHAGQGNGFFRLEGCGGCGFFTHCACLHEVKVSQ